MSSARELLKRFLPPALYLRAMDLRRRARRVDPASAWSLLERLGRPEAVLAGPFAGTRLPHYPIASPIVPMLLGTYEKDLHAAVERLCRLDVDVLVNVGAGEGYYAACLARRLPRARVFAFDTDRLARHVLRRTAAANHVLGQVVIAGACTPERLEEALAGARHGVVVSDCEGYERELLDPRRAPSLARATLLVEAHDMWIPGLSDELCERFRPTHRVTRIEETPRTRADVPEALLALPEAEGLKALSDGRVGRGLWLLLEPLDAGGSRH